jgi:hypothetical protein
MMKRVLLIMVITASIFSCQKDSNIVTPPYMDCKADGGVVEFTTRNAIVNGTNLQITGINASSVAVSLSINNISSGQTGTFNIGSGNFNTASYTDATGGYSAGSSAGTGQISIVVNDGSTLQGSFQFTGQNLAGKTKVVTEGRFMIYR